MAAVRVFPARREQIRHHIEAHLLDPVLTPARIAAALHISTRYLHQVFNEAGETVARYILRRRVEECARALHDAAQAALSVTDIAFRHGFNDASHFGRVFRANYGVTPREYRRRQSVSLNAATPVLDQGWDRL
jgi:AraC family transcriptional regulator, positive regulator of tynA and feaB